MSNANKDVSQKNINSSKILKEELIIGAQHENVKAPKVSAWVKT